MVAIKHEIHRTPRVTEGLGVSSSAIRPQVSRRRLLTVVALTCLLAVAAAYLTTHGWSDVARDLSNAHGHLPKPMQILLGGSRMAHLLAAAAR